MYETVEAPCQCCYIRDMSFLFHLSVTVSDDALYGALRVLKANRFTLESLMSACWDDSPCLEDKDYVTFDCPRLVSSAGLLRPWPNWTVMTIGIDVLSTVWEEVQREAYAELITHNIQVSILSEQMVLFELFRIRIKQTREEKYDTKISGKYESNKTHFHTVEEQYF